MAVVEQQERDEPSARSGASARSVHDIEEQRLVERARRGDSKAMYRLIRRYASFVRLKSSSYFLAGGDSDDLVQEGLIGFYKAVRDYRPDRESSFRSFAELCVTRQIITAIKTATRNKHTPLNSYVSFSHTPAGQTTEVDCTLGDSLAGPQVDDPLSHVISRQELASLVDCLGSRLSGLERDVLAGYLAGYSYEQIAERVECDTKTVDNALQRVKRKVVQHLDARHVPE